MELPLVSVIIPAYNAENFLRKAVDSILEQTYKNIEIWLLDDGSTDKTRDIIESYNDSRIKKFYENENTKKIGIVNKVLKLVNGEYIAFQDADDWSDKTRIEKQVNAIKNKNIDLVFTNVTVRHNSNQKKIDVPQNIPITDEEIKKAYFTYGKGIAKKHGLAIATMLVKKSIIDETGGYNTYFYGKAGSDIYWIYQILKKAKSFCIDEPLYHIVRTPNSFTHNLHSYKNIKSAYIWKIISKLIEYDQQGVDLLDKKNKLLLKNIELEMCEQAFKEAVEKLVKQKQEIKNSTSFKLGNLLIQPFSVLKKILKR